MNTRNTRNTRQIPSSAELPSSQQLQKSTFTAIAIAALLLVTVVLPSEYAIDPTGIGRALGLNEMGEIKTQLAAEAEADRAVAPAASETKAVSTAVATSAVAGIVGAKSAEASPPAPVQKVATQWKDEVTFVLEPGQGVEYKLRMKEAAKANFEWTAKGGVVNYDTHGDASGKSISYEKGRAVGADTGELKAAFTGNHGWFWRNRGQSDVTMTLRVSGDYEKLSRQ